MERLTVGINEAAEMLGICQKTVYTMTSPRGDLPCVRVGTRVLYSVEDIRAWVESRKTRPATEPEGGAE